MGATVGVPGCSQSHILGQRHRIVDDQAEAAGPFFDIKPAEYVDDAHHHVVDDLLPLGHAKVSLTLDDPEGHDTPEIKCSVRSCRHFRRGSFMKKHWQSSKTAFDADG